MKKLIAVAFVAGLVGFAAGNAFWYLASPLWIDQHVAESASAAQTATVIAQGDFQGADRVHQGRGQATLFSGTDGARLLRLSDFEVTNGPDLVVWLVGKSDIASADDVMSSEYLPLGQLKGNILGKTQRLHLLRPLLLEVGDNILYQLFRRRCPGSHTDRRFIPEPTVPDILRTVDQVSLDVVVFCNFSQAVGV